MLLAIPDILIIQIDIDVHHNSWRLSRLITSCDRLGLDKQFGVELAATEHRGVEKAAEFESLRRNVTELDGCVGVGTGAECHLDTLFYPVVGAESFPVLGDDYKAQALVQVS